MTKEYLDWLLKLIRENKLVKFYQAPAWRAVRLDSLIKYNYECQTCKRKGKYSKAQNVHHIKEVKKFPLLALDLDNTEPICIPCHNKEHDRFGNSGYKKRKTFTNFVDKEDW